MSKADEMFEKLGYKLINNSRYILYQKEVKYTQGNKVDSITFDTGLARYKKERLEIGFAITTSAPEFITKEELQAINEKCKELRMDRIGGNYE